VFRCGRTASSCADEAHKRPFGDNTAGGRGDGQVLTDGGHKSSAPAIFGA
jgi:hypothetical protein